MSYQEMSTSNSLLKIGVGVVLLSFVVSTGLWWYLAPNKPVPLKVVEKPSSPDVSEPSCNPNEIKNFDGKCVPKPPSLSALQKQVEDIKKQLDTIQKLNNSNVESLTAKLDDIQGKIESVQMDINNSPESYGINVLQEQVDNQQKRQWQLAKMLLADKNIPKCLSSAPTELQKKLPMFLVPAIQEEGVKMMNRWPNHQRLDASVGLHLQFGASRQLRVPKRWQTPVPLPINQPAPISPKPSVYG